jgi:hypothetical protein
VLATPLTATAAVVLRGFLSARSLLAAAIVLLAAFGVGVALSDTSLGPGGRLESDVAWALAEIAGWALAVIHGAGLASFPGVLAEMVLARPVPAGLLLGGRFLGLAGGLFVCVAAVSASLAGWLFLVHGNPPGAVLWMGWLLWLRLVVVLAVSTALLALTRPAVATPLAALVSLTGWLAASLPAVPGPAFLKPLTLFAAFVLPDLRALDGPLAGFPEGLREAGPILVRSTLYALAYTAAMMAAAVAVFPRRARRLAVRVS